MTRETTLERDWRISSGCGPFSVIRLETYHATYGCSFRTPVLRTIAKGGQETIFGEPTPEWIAEALDSMVRDEGGGRHEGVPPTTVNREETITISDEIVYDLLTHYEAQIAFGERTEAILEDGRFQKPEDKISAILREPTLGNRKNAHQSTVVEIARGFEAACASGGPLVFLLPAFPFKDQNPFRSDLPPSVPDFSEIAMLIHLHCLAMAINQVFRHDVMWLIVSDGTVYEEMFGADPGSGRRYISALRDWRSRLNVDGSIHFIDLQDLVRRHDEEFRDNPKQRFSAIRQHITESLRSAVTEDSASPNAMRSNLAELARGMLWNRGWNEAVQRYGLDALWQVHVASCEKGGLAPGLHAAADELWSRAVDTAIRYAGFNLASRYSRLLFRFMPFAVRATSHVKPGQVGIPRETGVAPWNGLAVYERQGSTSVRVRSAPLCQIPQAANVRFQLHGGAFGFGFAAREAIGRYL